MVTPDIPRFSVVPSSGSHNFKGMVSPYENVKSSEDLVELYFMVQCSFTLNWVALSSPAVVVR
jgi:hypothetical protein